MVDWEVEGCEGRVGTEAQFLEGEVWELEVQEPQLVQQQKPVQQKQKQLVQPKQL